MHSAGFTDGQRGQTNPMRDGRHETELEAVDRQLDELLQEMRVVQTGVQVLFAFLLSVPFTQRFDTTSHAQQELYFATLLLAGSAVILLLAPIGAGTAGCFASTTSATSSASRTGSPPPGWSASASRCWASSR